jgi:hypothetical protein
MPHKLIVALVASTVLIASGVTAFAQEATQVPYTRPTEALG